MENIVEFKLNEIIYSSHIFWTGLIKTIYNSYKITNVINKNKNYINNETLWYNGKKIRVKLENEGIKFAHKKYVCKGYDDCECETKLNRRKVKDDEIKYVFEGKFNFDNNIIKDLNIEINDEEANIKSSIKEILSLIEETNKKNPISNMKFVLDKILNLENNNGFNENHRGLDHMVIELPFKTYIQLPNEFTLEDLITNLYNLKSHKFDFWYELFCDTNIKVKNNQINVSLNFDHGS